MGGTDDLGGDFRENEDGKGDGECAGGQRPFLFAEECDGDCANECRCGGVDQIIAKQDDAKHFVGLVKQGGRFLCAVMSGLGQMAKAKTVAGHHGSFAERKKSRQSQQDNQHYKQRR